MVDKDTRSHHPLAGKTDPVVGSEIAPLSPGGSGGSQADEARNGKIIYSKADLLLFLAQEEDKVIQLPSPKEMLHG